MRVFKYHLIPTDNQWIQLPKGSELLTVQIQHGAIQLWAKVPMNNQREVVAETYEQWIYMRGTGHELESAEDAKYLGTVQLQDGALVLHVFAEI